MTLATVWTIGHSNQSLEEFLATLTSFSIEAVADVRRFPGSRRHPQFGGDQLEQALGRAGIEYHHLPGLGGRRTWRAPDSRNSAWRIESFNAYADHMQTDEFSADFAALQRLAADRRTAITCAEAVPWRCHRRLIADAFVAAGWKVLDIYSPGRSREHELTEFAKVEHGRVIYPGVFDTPDE